MPKNKFNTAQSIDVQRILDIYKYVVENKDNPDLGWNDCIKIFKSIPMKNMPGKIRKLHTEALECIEALYHKRKIESESCILERASRIAVKD